MSVKEIIDLLNALGNVSYLEIYTKAKGLSESKEQFNIVMLEGRKTLNCFK